MKIYLSKKKLALLFLACILFLVFGIWGIISPEDLVTTTFRNPLIIKVIGIIGVCFFGPSLILIVYKFFDSRPGLIINQAGIIDNSNSANIGLIEWKDIKGFEKIKILSTKILIVYVKQPNKYIARANNFIARKSMQRTYEKYGSPISLASSPLKINFEELEKIITEEWKKSKVQKKNDD